MHRHRVIRKTPNPFALYDWTFPQNVLSWKIHSTILCTLTREEFTSEKSWYVVIWGHFLGLLSQEKNSRESPILDEDENLHSGIRPRENVLIRVCGKRRGSNGPVWPPWNSRQGKEKRASVSLGAQIFFRRSCMYTRLRATLTSEESANARRKCDSVNVNTCSYFSFN